MKYKLKYKFSLLFHIGILAFTNSFAQIYSSYESHKVGPAFQVDFSDLTKGGDILGWAHKETSILNHLTDSLQLTSSELNENYHVISFRLTIKYNGRVIKSFVNNFNNKLTTEMQNEVVKFHPAYYIIIDEIKVVPKKKDIDPDHPIRDIRDILKFTLK